MSTARAEFKDAAARYVGRVEQRDFLRSALRGYDETRGRTMSAFADYPAARDAARRVKWEAIQQLPDLLEQFAKRLEARGGRVFWAGNAAEAVDYIRAVARRRQAKRVVKSKCMTSEEIHLNEALERDGLEVVETDLGEYICQLRKEPPFHFVFPCMHLKRDAISDVFEQQLGSAPSQSPEELTMVARRALRQKYLEADIGISGGNFLIAETGQVSITENEGNARLCTSLPPVHIALVGIEKVLPRLADLALFLPLLATSGTGQALTCYNSLIGGPRQPGEPDGPEEFHVVLLDNHRSRLLADPERRDALRCIRCGACLNVCPVFKNIGGHSYGTTYQGPIGAVITPHLRGLRDWGHLSQATSLCGACTETCPVGIDLHHHLLGNRQQAMAAHPRRWEQLGWRAFAALMRRPAWFARAGRMAARALGWSKAWSGTRAAPPTPAQSFRTWWQGQEGSRRG